MFEVDPAKLEDRCRSALSAAQMGTWAWNPRSDEVTWSEHVGPLFGLPLGSTPSGGFRGYLQLVHPDDRQYVEDRIGRALRDDTQYSIEFRTIWPDGSVHWQACDGSIDRASNGEILRIHGVDRDITASKQTALKLIADQERLSKALKALDVAETGTCHWNMRSGALSWDENLIRLFGLTPDIAPKQLSDFFPLVHPDDLQSVAAACRRCSTEGANFDEEYRIRHPDGAVRWIQNKAKVYSDDNGQPLYLMGACTDVTSQKQQENELKRTIESLERSNEDLSYFAYSVSHELQTPLRNFGSCAAILARADGTRTARQTMELLGQMLAGVVEMEKLIQSLLSYGHVDRGQLLSEPLNLNEVIQQVKSNLGGNLPTDFNLDCCNLPTLVADPVLLPHLFENLLSNALKYRSSDRPLQVRISAQDEGRCWQFCVEDNGLGIRNCDMEGIFGAFRRLHGREIPGTGMGLALCRRIVERHGGQLWVESEFGSGSRFYFTLPSEPSDALTCGNC